MKLSRVILAAALGTVFLGSILQEPARAMSPSAGFGTRQDAKLEELRKVRRDRRQKENEVAALKKDKTDEGKKKAEALKAEIEALGKTIAGIAPDVAKGLLKDLKGGTPEVVAKTTALLAEVGKPATADLETLAKSGSPDEQARAQAVLKLIKDVEAGDDGLWKQWASSAKASSEFSGPEQQDEDDWAAKQACGKPDTDDAGDHPTAWASATPDGEEEWLELTYKIAVRPTRIRIHETFNPGAVTKIEAMDADKKWQVLWKGKDTTDDPPAFLEVNIDPPKFAVRTIRITIDSENVAGWNEIDAVQLLGEPTGDPVAADKTDKPAKK